MYDVMEGCRKGIMEVEIKCEADEMWDSGIEEAIEPIHRAAIDLYADKVIASHKEFEYGDGKRYIIRMMRNRVIESDIASFLWPESKDAEYQINVEVGVSTDIGMRWFVGIYYKMKDGKWITDSEAKNSYLLTSSQKGKSHGD